MLVGLTVALLFTFCILLWVFSCEVREFRQDLEKRVVLKVGDRTFRITDADLLELRSLIGSPDIRKKRRKND